MCLFTLLLPELVSITTSRRLNDARNSSVNYLGRYNFIQLLVQRLVYYFIVLYYLWLSKLYLLYYESKVIVTADSQRIILHVQSCSFPTVQSYISYCNISYSITV